MEKRNNTKVLTIVLSVVLVLSLLAAAGIGIYYTMVEKRLEGCRILEEFVKRENMELRAEVTADLGGSSFSGGLPVFRRNTEAGSFFGIVLDGQTLYLRDTTFYLANGRGFRISVRLPQADALLKQAQMVLSTSKVTREQSGALTVYRAEAGLDQAKAILKYLSPETAEKMSVIDSLVVTLTAEGGTLRKLTLEAAGSDGVKPYTLGLTLSVLTSGTLDTEIPQAVLAAVKNPGDILTLRWDPDALPLLRGVLALASGNDFEAELGLGLRVNLGRGFASVLNILGLFRTEPDADSESGILSVSENLTIQYNAGVRPGIGRVAGQKLEFYFSGSRLCTTGGTLLTEYDELPLELLPALALPVLVEGKVEMSRDGDSGRYTMPLNREELDMIASAAGALFKSDAVTISLTEGTLEGQVVNNRLTKVSFSCDGTVTGTVLFSQAEFPTSLEVTLTPVSKPRTLAIPDAVRAALGVENG